MIRTTISGFLMGCSFSCMAMVAFADEPATSGDVTQQDNEVEVLWRRAARIDEPLDGFTPVTILQKYPTSTVEYWLWADRYWTRQRVEGIKFWNQYPNDRRRYRWLAGTIWFPPFFWKDSQQGARMYVQGTPELAELDFAAIEAWQRQYVVMRAEMMASVEADHQLKHHLRTVELAMDAGAAQFAVKRGESIDLTPLITRMMDLAADSTPEDRNSRFFVGTPENILQITGDEQWEAAVLDTLQKSPYEEFRTLATGRQQVAKLRSEPLNLSMNSFNGPPVKLEALRGKVVLVDIWSNSCSSCIEAMPKLRKLYDQYRSKGFEIVGVWINRGVDEAAVRKARNILQQQQVNWPNGLLQGEDANGFASRYSIIGVPVTWLIDQKGLLITSENLNAKHLEDRLQKLLGPVDGAVN